MTVLTKSPVPSQRPGLFPGQVVHNVVQIRVVQIRALSCRCRLVELRAGEVAYENIGFTGEVLAVRSLCSYYGERPILANLEIDFGFGRGPAAQGSERTYEYFVAVTRRDMAVMAKEVYPVRVRFAPDQDRVFLTETIDAISIPRANEGTSGVNFEILVGFELTPEQIAFNRSGQRFRVAAGQD